MLKLSDIISLSEAAKKKKKVKRKKPEYTPIVIDPEIKDTGKTEYIPEAKNKDDKDLPGHQSKNYYKGLDKKTKEKREKHFKKQTKMSWKDPDAYKEAPGDDKKTKISKHTKKYREMFEESLLEEVVYKILDEASINKKTANVDNVQKSLAYNMAALSAASALIATKVLMDPNYARNNKSLTARFNDALQRAMNVIAGDTSILQKLKANTNVNRNVMNEEARSLEAKAQKSGIPLSVLRKVYNRGLAAWRTGHRPGASQHAWAHARVNSFITKGKGTWGGADKDLASKVKGK